MMYPYMILADGTEVVHSPLISEGETKKVIVDFKRQTDKGFSFARCELPEYKWTSIDGYSDEDLNLFAELLYSNMNILFEYAANRVSILNNKVFRTIVIAFIIIVVAVGLYIIMYGFLAFFSMSSFERGIHMFLNP